MFLGKRILKICSKFTGEHPCRSVISIKLQSNFIEIALRHGCFPVNLLHIFRAPFLQNTSGWLVLYNDNVHLLHCCRKMTLNFYHTSTVTDILPSFCKTLEINTAFPIILESNTFQNIIVYKFLPFLFCFL